MQVLSRGPNGSDLGDGPIHFFYRVFDEKLEGQPMLYNTTRWNYVDAR